MCKVCQCKGDFKQLEGLKKLNCYGCPLLMAIPVIAWLQELDCSYCPNLTAVPDIPWLITLVCYNCPRLITVPNIAGLVYLYCANCPLLYIPGSLRTLTWVKSRWAGRNIRDAAQRARVRGARRAALYQVLRTMGHAAFVPGVAALAVLYV